MTLEKVEKEIENLLKELFSENEKPLKVNRFNYSIHSPENSMNCYFDTGKGYIDLEVYTKKVIRDFEFTLKERIGQGFEVELRAYNKIFITIHVRRTKRMTEDTKPKVKFKSGLRFSFFGLFELYIPLSK